MSWAVRGCVLSLMLVLSGGIAAQEPASEGSERPLPAPEPGAPATPTARSLEIPVLLNTRFPDGTAQGSCRNARITIDDQHEGAFRIGFFETEVGGSGPQWQSAGWMAACVAAQLSGYNPSTTKVSFDVGGRIDGPSAGCIMTVGVLAALRGDAIRPEVCMTGTINPDGSVGPVGAIPQKIIGAAQAGKSIVLIPGDWRREFDVNQKKVVDLVAHGRAHGVEVKQVSDVYMAYELLTGRKLPRWPAAEHPDLTAEADRLFLPYVDEWIARYQKKLHDCEQADEQYVSEYSQSLVEAAQGQFAACQNLLDEGETCGAYSAAVNAVWSLENSLNCIRINSIKARKGLDEAKKAVQRGEGVVAQIDLLSGTIADTKPETIGEAGMYLSACGGLMQASALCLMAEGLLARTIEDDDQAFDGMVTAGEHYVRAMLNLDLAREVLEVGPKLGGAAMPSEAPLLQAADFFQHAADANLQVFEDVHINPQAKEAGLQADVFRLAVMELDDFYARTRALASGARIPVYQRLGDTPAFAYARLASSIDAYCGSSLLIAKYYSRLARIGEDGKTIEGVAKEKTLLRMLDLAEDQARRSIRQLVDRGADASVCIDNYKLGRLYRQRTPQDQLDSLLFLWQSHVTAQALSYLAGFAHEPPPAESAAGQ